MSRKKKRANVQNQNSAHTDNSSRFSKVKPRTKNQREFLRAIYNNSIVFCVGVAGSGKTHLSVGAAVDLLNKRTVERIVITRPIMEAGQAQNRNKSVIGYLPGPIDAKMAPFLRPIHDELDKFIGPDAVLMLKKKNILEICPLEHMRGRTFENTFIIADEVQNATEEQLEMLLTRLGMGSIMVLVGDVEQSDLPSNLEGGFENFIDDLDGLEGLAIIELEASDIQRHPLVKAIIERRKLIKENLNQPVSWKDVEYDRQSKQHTLKDTSSERQHDADTSNSLDGLIQEDIQGNNLS